MFLHAAVSVSLVPRLALRSRTFLLGSLQISLHDAPPSSPAPDLIASDSMCQHLGFDVRDYVRDHVRDHVRDYVRDHVRDYVRDHVRDYVRDYVRKKCVT